MPLQTSNSVVAFVGHDRQPITRAWIEAVGKANKGRLSAPETERELLPLFDALVGAAEQNGFDLSAPAFGEVRAMLTEYSRSRARQGFSPTETAIAVFALRDAVLDTARSHKTPPYTYGDFAAFSTFIDQLGLITFEAFLQTREAAIVNQAQQLLELSTPVV